jgi:ribosome-associated protein
MNERQMQKNDHFILNTIAQTIFDKKGMNILALDVRSCSSLTDYVIIAEGSVDKHVVSIASAVARSLSEIGISPCHQEGFRVGDWIVLDYINIMIHLFIPVVREKYQLEELWREGAIVDLSIDVSSSRTGSYAGSERSVSF